MKIWYQSASGYRYEPVWDEYGRTLEAQCRRVVHADTEVYVTGIPVMIRDIELYSESTDRTYGIEAVGAYDSAGGIVIDHVVFSNFNRGFYAYGLPQTDLNWQIENGLHYFVNRTRNNVAVARMNDVLPYAPVLIRDNLAINRQVFVTERAAATLQAAYGSALTLVPDPEISSTLISDLVRDLPLGTRYVVCVLSPPSGTTLNNADIQDSLEMLSGARIHAFPSGDYAAMAGLVGEPPALVQSGERPFRADVTLAGVRVTVRMDAWLAFDTIRRMGFGHVVSDRKHSLIVERGVSFVAFDATGQPIRRGYAGGLFAPQPRFVVRLGAEG